MRTVKLVYVLPFLALIGAGQTAEASDVKLHLHLGYGYVPWPSYYSVHYYSYYPRPYYRHHAYPKHYPHYHGYPRAHYYPRHYSRPHDGHHRFRDRDRSGHHGHRAPHHGKRDSFASVIRPGHGKGSPGGHRRR